MPTTVSGSVVQGSLLSASERLAAQNALTKLNQSSGSLGKHLGGNLGSATVPSGTRTSSLATSTLLSARTADTFMGGARNASLGQIGNDTVVSGSRTPIGSSHTSAPLAGRGAQHLTLSADTINPAGATAVSIHTEQHQPKTGSHTITLADKTTIKIAGLAAHDISKLHH